jgi:hypothetical protein
MNIHFEKAALKHIDIIFSWLQEKHIQEFWDNSQNHKDDILNFIHEKPQKYFAGTTKYWVGYIDGKPYAFILSDILERTQTDLSEVHLANMSQVGHTISLDFGIGNKKYLGCGLGAPTLSLFIKMKLIIKRILFLLIPMKIILELSVYIIKPALIKQVSMRLPKDALFGMEAI